MEAAVEFVLDDGSYIVGNVVERADEFECCDVEYVVDLSVEIGGETAVEFAVGEEEYVVELLVEIAV